MRTMPVKPNPPPSTSLPAIKVISFDLDDTLWSGTQVLVQAEQAMLSWLANHTPSIHQALSKLELRQRKLQFIKERPHLRYKVSQARLQFLEKLFSDFHYPHADTLAQQCFAVFYEARQQVTLFPGVKGALAALQTQVKLIAITNGNADIEAVGLSDYFEFCLNGEDFPYPKPHGEIFRTALAQAGVAGHECLHVGDHPEHDMLGAKEAGLMTCWLQDGRYPWQHDFTADLTISHVRELLPLFTAQHTTG